MFLTFFYLYSMQLFSADTTIFFLKIAHNRPQTFFSQVQPGCPNQPRIDFSYYKYVPRLICLLICGHAALLCFYFGKEKRLKKAGNHEVWCLTRSWTWTIFYLFASLEKLPKARKMEGGWTRKHIFLFFLFFRKGEKTEKGKK